jgi:NAD(P)H-dependent FMN reductase
MRMEMSMLKIGIILGSTRPNRIGEPVARWVHEIAARRTDAQYDLIDLKNQALPLLDEPAPPLLGQYSQPHTKAWAAKITQYDGFVFITAEYNHGIPGALKNAIDYLFKEWNNKAAGIVSYGSEYGARAAEALRLVMGEIMMAAVREQVLLSLFTDFENYSTFRPAAHHEKSMNSMLDQVVSWSRALRALRENAA